MEISSPDGQKSILPKVSVIIPFFNQKGYLNEAIESVLAQTFKDFEIIVVDDGSTDEYSLDVLRKIGRDYPEIKIIHQPNTGLPGARNTGIRASKGDFFLALDADDTIRPTMLEKCHQVLAENDNIGFAYTYVHFFGDYEAVWKTAEYNFYDLLFENQLTACALVRKSAWEEAGGYDESMTKGHEDWEFWINLGRHGWFGKLIKVPLFNYRRHGDSLSDETRQRHLENFEYIKKKHRDVYEKDSLQGLKLKWRKNGNEKGLHKRYKKLQEKLEITGVVSFRNWLRNPAYMLRKVKNMIAKRF